MRGGDCFGKSLSSGFGSDRVKEVAEPMKSKGRSHGIAKAVLILPAMSLVGAVIVLGAVRTVGRDMERVAAQPAST